MDIKPVGSVLGGEFHYISPGHGLVDGALLYSQRAIDSLVQSAAALRASLADAEGELEFVYARAERAEAEAARLRKHVPVALRGEG